MYSAVQRGLLGLAMSSTSKTAEPAVIKGEDSGVGGRRAAGKPPSKKGAQRKTKGKPRATDQARVRGMSKGEVAVEQVC